MNIFSHFISMMEMVAGKGKTKDGKEAINPRAEYLPRKKDSRSWRLGAPPAAW